MKTQQEEPLSVIVGANELGSSSHVTYNNLEFVLRTNTKSETQRHSYEIQVWRRVNPMWVHVQHYTETADGLHLYAEPKECVDASLRSAPIITITRQRNAKMPVVLVNGQEHLRIDTGNENYPAYIRIMYSVLWS